MHRSWLCWTLDVVWDLVIRRQWAWLLCQDQDLHVVNKPYVCMQPKQEGVSTLIRPQENKKQSVKVRLPLNNPINSIDSTADKHEKKLHCEEMLVWPSNSRPQLAMPQSGKLFTSNLSLLTGPVDDSLLLEQPSRG